MASVRLGEMEDELNNLCTLTNRPKSFYIKKALRRYLDDIGDSYIALERIAKPKRKFLTSKEILKKLDQ